MARLGFVADFLTKSVVTGFIFGLAITIVVGQLPKLLGVPSVSGSVPDQLRQLVAEIPNTDPYTLAIGLVSLALIVVLRLVSRRIPGPLIALVLGLVAVPVLHLQDKGVSVVGAVATGLPTIGLPIPPVAAIPVLILGASGIVFLAVGESVGAGRGFASRHRYEIDADQELLALGAANIASGLFGGFTTDASLSQTATAEAAGAKSQLSSLVTAGLILATAVFLAPLFADLPNAVLGAIVIAASLSLMDVTEMRRYWAWRRTDFLVAIVALVGVLLTTVLTGLAIAVLLSVAFLLYRASRPYVAALGRIPGYRNTFGDVQRHPDAEIVPDLLLVRIDAPLYFFNANVAKAQILDLVAARDPAPRGHPDRPRGDGRPRRDHDRHAVRARRRPRGALDRADAGAGQGLGARSDAPDGADGADRRGPAVPVDGRRCHRLPAPPGRRRRRAGRRRPDAEAPSG